MTTPIAVLIVEDCADDAELMARALRAGGFEPDWQRVDTEDGLRAALASRTWDVILSDHRMPRLSSTEAMRIVGEADANAPLLLVSGSIGEEAAVAAMRSGVRDWVSKADLGRLAPAVDRELEEAEGRRAHALAEQRLREAEERYRSLVERIPAATFVADDRGAARFVSPQIEAQTGFTAEEWMGQPDLWFRRLHPEDLEPTREVWERSRASRDGFFAEYRLLRKEGEAVWLQAEGQWSRESDGTWVIQGFTVDVTERKDADARLRHVAYHDPLTDLPNGRLLLEHLESAIVEATHRRQALSVFQVELKRIVDIKNTLGRHNGELLIRKAAEILAQEPGIDLVSSVGPGAFALVAAASDADRARRIAESIVRHFEQPITMQDLPIEVGVDVGIAVFPGHGNDAEVLLRRADVALAQAQHHIGGVALYSKDHDPYDPRRLLLMSDLRAAIEANDLRLEYQPKIDLTSGRVVGVEALVRWRHPEFGNIRPDEFVPLAEESALIRPLTDWVLGEAFRQCHAWRQAGLEIHMSINLSARNLQDPGLVERIESLLETWGVEPSWIVLEITESALMADPKRAEMHLAELSERGMTLSIDDFGTGYSSLSYLRRLPVGEVKIDRSFVIGLTSDQGDLPIVRTIIDCGHHLGLAVVAEGVEDARTWDLLSDAGCDLAQGYYMGRPMTATDFGGWVRRSDYGIDVLPKDEDDAEA
jgi:PAS domain S-box-containing protein/diguanylate cyclase (GGDEF)-like protein